MVNHLWSAVLLASLVISAARVHAQSQAEMNAGARADFLKADAELNQIYEALLKKLPNTVAKEKLKQTQRAWIAFRDAEAAFEADEAGRGTMAAALLYGTKTELTEQRTKQLKSRLEERASPDEKDSVATSPTPVPTSSPSKPAAAPKPTSISLDRKSTTLMNDEAN